MDATEQVICHHSEIPGDLDVRVVLRRAEECYRRGLETGDAVEAESWIRAGAWFEDLARKIEPRLDRAVRNLPVKGDA